MKEHKIVIRSFYCPSGFSSKSIDFLLNSISNFACELDPEITAGFNVISHGEHAEVVITVFDYSLNLSDLQDKVEDMARQELKKHDIIFIKE